MPHIRAIRPPYPLAYPFAVEIAAVTICAVTAETWINHLNRHPQVYGVVSELVWLDGYCVELGVVFQFLAMSPGDGYTVEERLTGAAAHGALQIVAYPMKREQYRNRATHD